MTKKLIKFNINNDIRAELTDEGIQKVLDDGWTLPPIEWDGKRTFQAHHFFAIFGQTVGHFYYDANIELVVEDEPDPNP